MPTTAVTRRYARALYQEARAQDLLAEVDADVDLIHETLEGSRELVVFFKSPIISSERKAAVVQRLFVEHVSSLSLKFMELLITKQREELFPEMVQAYRSLRDDEKGIIEARAQVAYGFGEKEHAALKEALEQLTGKHIRLHTDRTEGLIGGLVVRVGDTVYDGSVRNRLNSLRERMERGVSVRNGST